jgi:hypothetical protein
MVQGAARTDKVPDLLVLLDSLVKRLDVLGQSLEILGRPFQSSEVGRGGIGSGERVQLDGGLIGSAPVCRGVRMSSNNPASSVPWQLRSSRTFKTCPVHRGERDICEYSCRSRSIRLSLQTLAERSRLTLMLSAEVAYPLRKAVLIALAILDMGRCKWDMRVVTGGMYQQEWQWPMHPQARATTRGR